MEAVDLRREMAAERGSTIRELHFRRRDVRTYTGWSDTQIRTYLRELEDLGIELRDLESGLVDFPAILDGNEVLLSWKLGESEITFMSSGGDDTERVPLPGREDAEPSSN